MEARPTLNITSKILAFITDLMIFLRPDMICRKGEWQCQLLAHLKISLSRNIHSSAKSILGRVTFRAAEKTWHVGPYLGEVTFRGFVQPKYVGSLP